MKFLICLLLSFVLWCMQVYAQDPFSIQVPLGGNAFSSKHVDESRTVTNQGIQNWRDPQEYFTVYFRINRPGSIFIRPVQLNLNEGRAVLSFTINGVCKEVDFDTNRPDQKNIGSWLLKDTGYFAVHIKGISKTNAQFPSIGSLEISGTAINSKTTYVKNNEGNFFHWGRRGASVHLNYQQPADEQVEWFYNEITVPEGEDLMGSYYMANGFGEGYFGMQVNSSTERHILFSVWSPFTTDDPKSIPESHKIKLLQKGEQVHASEFGNEGSGGQSYLNYPWKSGETYKFLLHGIPSKDSTTIYTAYFFAPELNKWQLIASFSRPKTQTYLKRLHSFLENFIPEQGDQTRRVLFQNQWICSNSGHWKELTSARFTVDNTGAQAYRMDYAGGVLKEDFYLQNGGFFNHYVQPKQVFERVAHKAKPEIDFSKLP